MWPITRERRWEKNACLHIMTMQSFLIYCEDEEFTDVADHMRKALGEKCKFNTQYAPVAYSTAPIPFCSSTPACSNLPCEDGHFLCAPSDQVCDCGASLEPKELLCCTKIYSSNAVLNGKGIQILFFTT